MNKLKLFAFLILVALVGLGIWMVSIYRASNESIQATQPVFFTVKPGETLRTVAGELQKQGVLSSASTLIWAGRFGGNKPVIAADYQLPVGMTITELYQALVQGDSLSKEKQVTMIEGLTLNQMALILQSQGVIASSKDFVTAATVKVSRFNAKYAFLADKPASATLEGYLFPDTYRFFPNTTPDDVITKMLDNFDKQVTPDMRAQIKASGRTLFEAVTLASVVEKEVRSVDEMKTVAGIFTKRLAIGMALQADSTVNYLTQSGRASSTLDETKIDSPYNTYKYPGLPVGPISNPGLNAIKAAVSPTKTNYLYFLTDDLGRVYYAETLAQHNRNRDIYLHH